MLAFGCAGTPKWVGGTSRSEFYYQGVGSSESATSAEERALFSLVAQIEGSEIQSVTEDYNRASSQVSGRKVTATDSSRLRQWISMRIEGKVPAEVRIQERFRDENQEWALAVVERPGQLRRTNRLYQSTLRNVKYHAFVPGWAQVQKRQSRRAYTYIGVFSAGVIGGISFAILSNHANARRDRATIHSR